MFYYSVKGFFTVRENMLRRFTIWYVTFRVLCFATTETTTGATATKTSKTSTTTTITTGTSKTTA